MKNDARKMALENQIELAQQNAIDFTHACMTIALHDVFGVGKDRLDKVTQRKDEINGELMQRMAIPAKNQKAQLNEAEKWLVGLLPEGVVSVFRIPVVKGVPRKRREVQLKMAIDRAATLEWRGYATACAQVLGFGPRRLEKLRQETIANFGQLNEAEKWLVGLLPEGVVSVFRIPVVKGVPRKRREVQLKMAIDRAATLEWRGYATACAQVLGFGPRRLEKLRQETIANFGQLNEWVETDGVDVAMEMLCRCARDAYKTEVEVLDVPDEAVLEKQRRETAETIRQLQVQAVQREVSRKRVPCVLPLSEAEVQRRVEAVTSSVHSSPEMSTVLSRRRI